MLKLILLHPGYPNQIHKRKSNRTQLYAVIVGVSSFRLLGEIDNRSIRYLTNPIYNRIKDVMEGIKEVLG